MSIQVVAEIGIKSGRVEDFKKVAAELIRGVEANEPGTWTYEWYLSDDESECYVLEQYADSAAALAHKENTGPLLGRFLETCSIDNLSVYGEVSEEVREAYEALTPSFFKHWSGISRRTMAVGKS